MPNKTYGNTIELLILGLVLSAALSFAIMASEDAPEQPTAVAHQITLR
jgi:hypothetical protein